MVPAPSPRLLLPSSGAGARGRGQLGKVKGRVWGWCGGGHPFLRLAANGPAPRWPSPRGLSVCHGLGCRPLGKKDTCAAFPRPCPHQRAPHSRQHPAALRPEHLEWRESPPGGCWWGRPQGAALSLGVATCSGERTLVWFQAWGKLVGCLPFFQPSSVFLVLVFPGWLKAPSADKPQHTKGVTLVIPHAKYYDICI